MTLERARVALGKSERTIGLTFVALSRVRRIADLLIDFDGFDSHRLTNIQMPHYVARFDAETQELFQATLQN